MLYAYRSATTKTPIAIPIMSPKTKKSHKQNTVKSNLYWNTLITIPSQIICFVISIFIARILAPTDFGIMAITMMTIGYANLITNFAFNQALVQKVITNKKVINSIFTLDLIISISLAATFFFGSEYISLFFNSPECKYTVRVLCLVFVVTTFQAIPYAILRRDMDFKTVSKIDVFHALSTSILTLIFAINHFQYWSLVYGQLISLIITTIALCIKAKWVPHFQYSHDSMKEVYHFGIWNFLGAQLNFFVRHIDKIIIGRFFGPLSLGYYDKSMSIAVVPSSSLIMNINSVMFSAFSKNKDSKSRLQEHFKKSLTIVSIISFPIYTGLITVAPYFVQSLLGEKWNPMIFPFQIILLGFLFKSFGGLISSMNVGIGKYKNHTLRLLLSGIIFVIMCFILLRFNLNGIALSFVIFSFTQFFLSTSLGISEIGISWKHVIHSILPAFIASMIMFLVVQCLAAYYLTRWDISNLALLSAIGATVYVLILFVNQSKAIVEVRSIIINDIKNNVLVICGRIKRSAEM